VGGKVGGFHMSTKVVGFTYLDVCLGLGLRVVGENIDLNHEGLNSDSKNLFGAAKLVHIQMVYDYILKHIQELCLEDCFKLYILKHIKVYLFNYSNAPELGFVILMRGKMRLKSIFSMFLFFFICVLN